MLFTRLQVVLRVVQSCLQLSMYAARRQCLPLVVAISAHEEPSRRAIHTRHQLHCFMESLITCQSHARNWPTFQIGPVSNSLSTVSASVWIEGGFLNISVNYVCATACFLVLFYGK